MRRELKFRCIKDKKINGYLELKDGMFISKETHEDPGFVIKYPGEYDFDSLDQFTGLKDKNGKEVYEGDIVIGTYLTGKLLTGRIWYDDKAAVFMVEDRYAWMWERKEVIGNIYESPSLLKDTQA